MTNAVGDTTQDEEGMRGMKEHALCISEPDLRAFCDGKKTQMRKPKNGRGFKEMPFDPGDRVIARLHHDPYWMRRIVLNVLSVRLDLLQRISPEDAIAEGFSRDTRPGDPLWDCVALQDFREYWDSTFPEYHWDYNPWVWRIDFSVVAGGVA